MSRTYRRQVEWYYDANNQYYNDDEYDDYRRDEKKSTNIKRFYNLLSWSWTQKFRINKKGRDRKVWNKPPKWFKQINRRIERSRVKQAMREGKEIPTFKQHDQWDWT